MSGPGDRITEADERMVLWPLRMFSRTLLGVTHGGIRMSLRRTCLLLVAGLAVAVVPPALAEPPKPDPDTARIARLIEQLGSESYQEREAATKALRRVGEIASNALLKAASESPDAEVRRRATSLETAFENAALPKGAKDWDSVGTYALADQRRTCKVNLYYRDSNSVAQKLLERGGIDPKIRPNSFVLHCVHQNRAGHWVHRELYSAVGVQFIRVKTVAPDRLIVVLRPIVQVGIEASEPGKPVKTLEDWNEPFTLRFIDGLLTMKAD